ncbi:MAG: glucose-6-phosphate isomerase family protein [Methanosarcinaceae archaeon]|nr:glucose-6-phosphate isomerase family protein [Methanosarcinaceae archaeon]MDD4331012.1 glucose-6-phosphate isomerase family protein [Methanosarcinaceae archaeon]MDD4749074.1 glucose-6-phosphate isomerase family protein [Methanosarcinaceae archaeon]
MTATLKFGDKISIAEVRKLSALKDVVFDLAWFEKAKDRELYYMFRDLAKNESELELIKARGLRYDITRIPAGRLGIEYVKTLGHYHPKVPGTSVSYPELYQVLKGSATYLLQKRAQSREDGIEDFVVVEAKAGDCVLIPPGYGHVTVNASKEELTMANWVCRDFASLYAPIGKLRGAAYYLLETGFVKNPTYKKPPPIRFLKPGTLAKVGLVSGKDMYELGKKKEKLGFLTAPQDYLSFFEGVFEPVFSKQPPLSSSKRAGRRN